MTLHKRPSSNQRRYSHRQLPDGTVFTLVSTKGSRFRIVLLSGVFEGHSRNVRVIEAPVAYDGPTIMCVVAPRTRVKLMAHAYAAALPNVGPGDTVYLIDLYASGPVRPFIVAEVTY